MKKRYFAVIILVILLDQISKYFAKNYLSPTETVNFIPRILGLTYVENKGAAFSVLSGSPIILKLISLILLGVLIYVLVFHKLSMRVKIAYSLLIGGAIGNIIDRFYYGYVVDFLEFLFIKFPIFNVSDIFVTVSVALLIFLQIIYKEEII